MVPVSLRGVTFPNRRINRQEKRAAKIDMTSNFWLRGFMRNLVETARIFVMR